MKEKETRPVAETVRHHCSMDKVWVKLHGHQSERQRENKRENKTGCKRVAGLHMHQCHLTMLESAGENC